MDSNGQKDLVPERRQRLQELVAERNFVRVDDLCQLLGVSPATVRRDLEAIEAQGLIQRVHGGAMAVENRMIEPLFDDKAVIAAEEKCAIARSALGLIEPGDTVYLDGGSTILELARLLADRADVTVVTNSLRAAAELSPGGPRLILVGGELRRRSQTIVGTLTRGTIDEIHVNKAFMGTIGLTLEEGMTTTDPAEAYTKELIMDRAQRVILLADSTKLGRVAFATAGGVGRIHVLVTDGNANEDMVRRLHDRGVQVVLSTYAETSNRLSFVREARDASEQPGSVGELGGVVGTDPLAFGDRQGQTLSSPGDQGS